MKKIALFIRSLNMGGAEKQSILLCENLMKYYEAYLVVLNFEGPYTKLAVDKKIPVIKIRLRGILKIFHFFYKMKQHRFDLLIAFLPVNNIIGGLLYEFVGIKHFIGGIRGTKIKKSKIKMVLSKYICNKRSSCFISNSEAGKTSYVAYGYDAGKVVVIPNCIEIRNMAKPAKNNREVTILSVGRLITEKDYPMALDAIAMLLHKVPDLKITYHIVGYGELFDEITSRIIEKGLEEYVVIHTGIDYLEVGTFYQKADIFLITSRFEGMPNTVMEAMDNYLPVVGTKAGDIDKLILHGENGFLSEIGDVQQIYGYLQKLSMEPNLREEFGMHGKKHLAEHFSIDAVGKQYIDLIESLS